MSDLLSREDYLAIAQDLSLPSNAHIDDKFSAPRCGDASTSVNPATGEYPRDDSLPGPGMGRSQINSVTARWPCSTAVSSMAFAPESAFAIAMRPKRLRARMWG